MELVNYSPLTWLSWILSLPFRAFAATVVVIRRRRYNPEHDICPSCLFRGDEGTAGKSCRVEARLVLSAEKIAIWHQCFRCSAEYWTRCATDPGKWYREPISAPPR